MAFDCRVDAASLFRLAVADEDNNWPRADSMDRLTPGLFDATLTA